MKKIVSLIALSICLFSLQGRAQNGNFYFNEMQVQRNNLNPAFATPYLLSVGVPGISGLNLRLENNFLSWNTLIVRGADDSLRVDLSRLAGKSNYRSRIAFALDEELLRFGCRLGRNNFVAGASIHADMQMVLANETLDFLLQGPGEHIGLNELSGNRLDINSYAYLYFGYSRLVNKNLTIGGRFKLLKGLYNLHTNNLKINFNILNEDMTSPDIMPYEYDLRLGGSINTNLPIQGLGLNMGQLTNIQFFRNLGMALDLGVNYHVGAGLDVSASILDLGFISWNDDNTTILRETGRSARFQGLDLIKITGGESSAGTLVSDVLYGIWDSIGFKKDTVRNAYTRALPASLNVGISYTLLKMHRFGVLLHGQFYNKYFAPEVSFSYTLMPCKNFALSVSNTFSSGNILNLGVSAGVNMGPVQFYLAVDRVNSFNVAQMRTFGLSFGLNVVLGKSSYDWYTGDVDRSNNGRDSK